MLSGLVAISGLIAPQVNAQSTPDIFIRSFTTHDSILLRWVPANIQTWKDGIKTGYTIERFTTDDYFDNAKGQLLATIYPVSKNDSAWKKLSREDDMNTFAYQQLYENSPQEKTNEQIAYGLVLKSCDLSLETAKACGFYFADKTVSPGQTYVYRVSVANSAHQPAILNTDGKLTVLQSPEKIKGEFRNKKASIAFDIASTRESCAGYIIERSEDSIHFTRINFPLLAYAKSQYELNKTELVYQDTFPQNHKTYWYRVRGYSYFGITGPPSKAVKGKGREVWTLYPEADTVFSADNKTVQVRWHVPDSAGKADLESFVILRASAVQEIFSPLNRIDKSVFSFTDKDPLASGYYEIAAVSIYGDTAFSFPYFCGMIDSIPPAVPENITGNIDTNGIVHLYWNKVNAADLKGYRIFRANSLKEEFVEVGDSILPGNFFTDTIIISTLTRNIYYEIRSVDRRYNNSANSEPYLLKRPDKILPVAPLVTSLKQTDSTISFSWINSSSEDVMCVELTEKSSDRILYLGSWSGHDTIKTFTQHNPVPGTEYLYTITVTDSSGNKSVTGFPAVKFSPRIYPALKNISAQPDFEKRLITLSWTTPQLEIDRYVIYKSKKGEPLRTWKTVDGKNAVITDKELYPGNTYIYKVKAVMKNGAETKLVSVEVVY